MIGLPSHQQALHRKEKKGGGGGAARAANESARGHRQAPTIQGYTTRTGQAVHLGSRASRLQDHSRRGGSMGRGVRQSSVSTALQGSPSSEAADQP